MTKMGRYTMRVTNLIVHIVAVCLMLPDLVFIGINTLMGLGYLRGYELIVVPAACLIFGAAFYFSTIGELIQFATYKKTRPNAYIRGELISHGLSALSYILAIVYMIKVALNSSSKGGFSEWGINIMGLVVCLVGIVITVVGSRSNKRANVISKAPVIPQVVPGVSRPKFCPNCGSPTGATGDFCGSCGAKLVR